MIGFSGSMATALSVAFRVSSLTDEPKGVSMQAYQNGREQGITITNYLLPGNRQLQNTCFIAENRGSDDIVVYFGRYSMQSVSEDAYSNSRYFRTVDDAARYIIDVLSLKSE